MAFPSIGRGPSFGQSSGSRLPTLRLPVTDAAVAGDITKVKQLVQEGEKIDERDHGGWTPFLKACEHGHLEIAKWLAQNGSSVHQESSFTWTALHQAAIGGHLDVVNWLISEKVEVDHCKNYDKHTPLFEAVSHGHVAVCEALVKAGANLGHVDKEKTPLLIQAAYQGHIGVVEFLIAQGADPTKTVDENYGNSLFMTACKWGHVKLVEWILQHVKGVDINEINRYGSHAMNHAVASGSLELAKLLVKHGWKVPYDTTKSPLLGCTDLDLAKYFVETLKLPVNVCSEWGTSSLGNAAYNGHLDVVKYLIAHGADPKYKGKPDASTALETAVMAMGNPNVDEVIAYLQSL
jgi:ankyrin repeat protein